MASQFQLAEAFKLLAGEKDLPRVRLLAAGYLAECDLPLMHALP